ncbi:MAG: HNH endonuclease signature motif containing protein [Pseudomonadota bacterium]
MPFDTTNFDFTKVTPVYDEQLFNELLHYEAETGKLYWKERDVRFFKDGKQTADHNCKAWNGRYAGTEAFTATSANGYKVGRIFKRTLRAHRVIWTMVHGEEPNVVDHINGVRADNRLTNLRSVTASQNSQNMRMRDSNTSGVTGVSFHKQRGRWQAYITVNNKAQNLGHFDNKDDAIAARKAAEIEHGFHPNHGRQKYDKNNPPKRMSEAIRMAVADLCAAEASPHYRVDMEEWHVSWGKVCHVCFAGSVMSQRLEMPFDRHVRNDWCPVVPELNSWLHVFQFLNCIRQGELETAKLAWLGERPGPIEYNDLEVTQYEDDSEQFKADMLALADRLEAEGS